jgi:tellurite resistance protein TerA
MYQLTDGSQPRVVQALDKNFGSLNSAPYVLLSGDDRSGGSENLKINLAKADEIKRLLVFAFIYAGSNWKKVGDAQVRIQNPVGGDDYLIRLEGAKAASCALIDLQNDGSGNLRMTRLEQYFRGFHQDIDSYYGWPNINWVKGSKD